MEVRCVCRYMNHFDIAPLKRKKMLLPLPPPTVLWLIAMIPIFVLFLGSMRTAVPISFATLLLIIAFILQGVNLLYNGGMSGIQYASGAFFIIGGIFFWYTAVAVLLQEEGVKILPVFPLPRVD